MTTNFLPKLLALCLCLSFSKMIAQPVINSIVPPPVSSIEKFEKLEINVDFEAQFDNPYDYDQVVLSAIFTAPDGTEKTVDGFFIKNYSLNQTTGSLSPTGEGFKIRFSPDQIGSWSYKVTVSDSTGMAESNAFSFNCTEASNSNNKGFVRTGNTNYLETDTEEQLILIGENISWQQSNIYTDYKKWLTPLIQNGGNFLRLWHAHWGLGIEWSDGWRQFKGLRNYQQQNCAYQDWLFDFCAGNGVYVMLTLQHHGQVSTQVNPNWDSSPYNTANQGPCAATHEFFTDSTAIAHTKNRLRYVVARWGYSRAIMAWELWNEVEWTDNFNTHRTKVQDWHTEMAAFLKENDPYEHIVTTSYAHDNEDPFVWSNPDIDLTQTHFYVNTPNLERALAKGVSSYLKDFEKPTMNGEFGLGISGSLSNEDPDGIHIHNSLWSPVFSGGTGTGMSWWWESYIHPRDLYYHFDPVSKIVQDIPFREKEMQPTTSYVEGAEGDLALTPTLGWGTQGDPEITINDNGTTDPEFPSLGVFLYGSSWNTQYRSPPVFKIDYKKEGTFSVTTDRQIGQSPTISIYIDSVQVLHESALINKTYTVTVPAGAHEIKVDNLGTDWITIQSYKFTNSGAGSLVDSYSMVSKDGTTAAGWILHNLYNHQNVLANGEPTPVPFGEVVLEGMATDNDYFVKWYDCLTGEIVAAEIVTAVDSLVKFPFYNLYWDLAFRVDDEPSDLVSLKDFAANSDINVFPNPLTAGESFFVKTDVQNSIEKVTVFNAAGKRVDDFSNQNSFEFSADLPGNTPSGLYWLKIKTANGYLVTKPIVVQQF